MNYLKDPGERFASDTHRRVLAHLTTPTDDYGWMANVLVNRMRPDATTRIDSIEEMQSILEQLEEDGHAERISTSGGDVWRMTSQGFDVLTGPIANEPEPGATVIGPALITDGYGGATSLLDTDMPGGYSSHNENLPDEEQTTEEES